MIRRHMVQAGLVMAAAIFAGSMMVFAMDAASGSAMLESGITAAAAASAVSEAESAASMAESAVPMAESAVSEAENAVSMAESAVSEAESAVSKAESAASVPEVEEISFDPTWEYAEYAKITSGKAKLYRTTSDEPKGKVVCINAGHGTRGGGEVYVQCHPDGSPKVTSGSTEKGAVEAMAVTSGTEMLDGTAERDANLVVAMAAKKRLLKAGYDVLMIRETEDVQLDNIARTLIANHYADCHIAIHYDSTTNDKGIYFMSVPNVDSFRNMEPVKSHWEEHNALGRAIVKQIEKQGLKLCDGGEMEIDLVQTSYSTIPSIDLEVGDRASDRSKERIKKTVKGLTRGLNQFFKEQKRGKKRK